MKRINLWQRLSVAQKIVMSFIGVILIGSALLSAPFSLQENQHIAYIDALFVVVSATCVTGLTPIVISEVFNPFGQAVILAMIQIGGVGLVTLISYLVVTLTNQLGLSDELVVKDMMNKEGLFQFKLFLKRLIKYVMSIELVGAVLLYLCFIPRYGLLQSVWHAIFLAISAFCNAGFDVLGATSLTVFVSDVAVQSIIMCLILLGGFGYVVWFDSVSFIKRLWATKSIKRALMAVSMQTKIVYKVNVFLISVPFALVFLTILTADNFGHLTYVEKLFAALFQTVTLRTAGFYTVDFALFNNVIIWLMLPVMFIGGASGGTAGGVKTTTVYVVYRYIVSLFKGQHEVVVSYRKLSDAVVVKSVLIFVATLVIWFVGVSLISFDVPTGRFLDYIFEATSAISTTGISTGVTSLLPIFSKTVVMLLMFIGRLGVITFVWSLSKSDKISKVTYPIEKLMVG